MAAISVGRVAAPTECAAPKISGITSAAWRPLRHLQATPRFVWFLLLIGYAHLGDWLYVPRARWAASMSGQALLTAVAVWMLRGPRSGILWPICLWGAIESLETFVCQSLYVWFPPTKSDPRGACVIYLGFDIGSIELLVFTIIIWMVWQYVNSDRGMINGPPR